MYLLDTNVLLWAMMNAPQLPDFIKEILKNQRFQIWVSAASIWEIYIKKNRGELEIEDDLEHFIDKTGFKKLDISFEHAKTAGLLPKHHNDPFDRMLIAQAKIENLRLITSDAHFKAYDVSLVTF